MSSPALSALGEQADQQRGRDLRKMKVVATGLLVFAACVYLVTRYLEARDCSAIRWACPFRTPR